MMEFSIGVPLLNRGTLVFEDGAKTEGSLVSRGLSWMRNFGMDVRFGVRQFRRAPAYMVFTVLVLALGIGTVTAMFTISYGCR